jgi:hypothetical protein
MKFVSIVVASIFFSVFLVSAGVAAKDENPPKPPKISGNRPIMIQGTASMVGQWSCGGDVKIQTAPDPSEPPAPGLPTGVQVSAVTSVPAIDCGDSTMNKHMQKALKQNQFPEIRFKTGRYDLIDNGKEVKTHGELTIAGVTKPVELAAKLTPVPQGGPRVSGAVDVDMADFGVKPPSLFFGSMKVAKTVTIRFDAVVPPPSQVSQSQGQ